MARLTLWIGILSVIWGWWWLAHRIRPEWFFSSPFTRDVASQPMTLGAKEDPRWFQPLLRNLQLEWNNHQLIIYWPPLVAPQGVVSPCEWFSRFILNFSSAGLSVSGEVPSLELELICDSSDQVLWKLGLEEVWQSLVQNSEVEVPTQDSQINAQARLYDWDPAFDPSGVWILKSLYAEEKENAGILNISEGQMPQWLSHPKGFIWPKTKP